MPELRDPFGILGLTRAYRVDLRVAEKTHRELSRALHPDRYVSAGASERRDALVKAVEVNEAWRVVRDPIRRAEALFALAGVAVGDPHEPKPAPALLMDMMEQREALSEARTKRDAAAVQALGGAISARAQEVESLLGDAFDAARAPLPVPPLASTLAPLVAKLGELRYYRRFLEEVSTIVEDLETPAIPS